MSKSEIQRKCPSCGTWNKANSHCVNCNALLDPVLIQVEESNSRKPTWTKKETAFDRFILKWQNHPFAPLRWLYKILYTIGVVFFAIASFFAWLAASPNG